MIAAVSPEGVIGLHGKIPWRHPGDMRRFARVTRGGTVIMGRLTWESMNRRPLPHRRNVVITRGGASAIGDVEHYPDIATALAKIGDGRQGENGKEANGEVWFIGGARIYEDAMPFCDVIDLTYVPEHVTDPEAVKFPAIDETAWEAGDLLPHEEEAGLTRRVYRRRRSA